MRPRIGQLLLDFDGVLACYRRERRIAYLAAFGGAAPARVREVLFGSGLEERYDAGQVDTAAYLRELGDGIGHPVDEAAWLAARLAGTEADPRALARVAALDAAVPLGVLTNNGVLMAQAIPRVLGGLHLRVEGRVLCSGRFGVRKPDPAVFRRALDHLGWEAASTLFVDDLFGNVQGARKAGLHADMVTDARALGRVLKRYGLA